jgi:Tol biopolymer transport system component/DNA-binding winged helix-turn-helix (wHTH) protein
MTRTLQGLCEFGPFRLDPVKRLLLRNGEAVAISPKAFDVLLTLVESGGEVVSKDDLMKRVWPDSFVEEGNLTYNISLLRRALGERANEHQYIVTVPGRGYRFVAAVCETHDGWAEAVAVGHKQSGLEVEARKPPVGSEEGNSSQTPPLAESLISKISRHKTGVAVIATATLLALIALGAGLYHFAGRSQLEPAAARTTVSSKPKIDRLTGSTKVQNAAVSPDGKFIVYAVKEGPQQSLWLRQVAVTSYGQILPPASVQYVGETFSPDGNFIYYVAIDANYPAGALYQVPVLGGTPRKILTEISSPITFSPDGARIAFVRSEEQTTGEGILMIADVDGTNERRLAVRSLHEHKWFGLGGPGWSPDGNQIAVPGGSEAGDFRWFVIVVDVESGAQTDFCSQKFLNTGRVCWLADKSGMVLSATTQQSDFKQIWLISYPGDEARQITHDLHDYNIKVSLTADSKSLVTVQNDIVDDIWVGPFDDPNQAKQITSGRRDGRRGLAWTPDGKIVYTSYLSGNMDIWIMNADGTNQKQLTDSPHRHYVPAVSSDGRYIVFCSNRAGRLTLWRMDADGANIKQLTNDQLDTCPQISPDGRWVVFTSLRSGNIALWKMPIDGGEAVQLTNKILVDFGISQEGKLIAGYYQEEIDSRAKVLVMPFEGGEPLKIFDMPTGLRRDGTDVEGPVVWTSDGRAILYLDMHGGTRNLWRQALDGGKPVRLTNFTSNGIRWSALSSDGRIAFTRETITSDVVLIRDFN